MCERSSKAGCTIQPTNATRDGHRRQRTFTVWVPRSKAGYRSRMREPGRGKRTGEEQRTEARRLKVGSQHGVTRSQWSDRRPVSGIVLVEGAPDLTERRLSGIDSHKERIV